MNWKRILRSCLCLIVVCCIILSVSPIKAHAFYAGGITDLGLSLGAWFLLQAAGVFFVEATEPLLNSLGDSFSSSLTSWGVANGKVDSVREFLALVALNGVGVNDRKVIIVPEDIMAGVVQWVLAIASLGVDVEVPSYSAGSSYPSSWPAIPEWDISSYPYFILLVSSPPGSYASFRFIYSDCPVSYLGDHNETWYYSPRPVSSYPSYTYSMLSYDSGSKSWSYSWEDRVRSNSDSLASSLYSSDYGQYYSYQYAERIAYSNYDIYDLDGNIYFEGDKSDVAYVTTTYFPEALVGDNFADGTPEEDDDLFLPPVDYSWMEFWEGAMLENLTGVSQDVINGSMTHEEYLEQSKADASTIVNNGTLANTQAGVFIRNLVDTLVDAISSVFVPSEDYLSDKFEEFSKRFLFVSSIVLTVRAISDALTEFETSPPIIYMELNAAEGSIYWGDRAVALDLTWYARYKPTVDSLLSAVLYAAFVWRVFVHLPNIISGVSPIFEGASVRRYD